MEVGQTIYFTRIIPPIFDLYELMIRTVEDGWFVGFDKKDGVAFLFNDNDSNVYTDRNEALKDLRFAESRYKDSITR